MTRWAHTIARHPWWVIALWLAVGVTAIPGATHIGDVLVVAGTDTNRTESAESRAVVREHLPRSETGALFVSVSVRHGQPDSVDMAVIERIRHALDRRADVDRTVGPGETDGALMTPDGRAAAVVVVISPAATAGLTDRIPDYRRTVADAVRETPALPPHRVHVTGEAALEWDTRTVALEDAARLERVALIPAFVVLVLAFGALAAAAIPVGIGVATITGAMALLAVLGRWFPLNVFAVPIVTMIGLGVGIDYSLLVVTRFREEVGAGANPLVAAARATDTAGRAVIVSGLTVAVGFGALLLTPAAETRSVGLGGMAAVGVAVLLAVSLLPAVLAVAGTRIDWPRPLARRLRWVHNSGVWRRWGGVIVRHRWPALLAGFAVIGLVSLPATRLAIGIPTAGWFPRGTPSDSGLTVLGQLGAGGAVMPIQVAVRAPPGERIVGAAHLRRLQRVTHDLAADPRVASVRGPVSLGGLSALEYLMLYGDLPAARARYPALDTYLSTDGRTGRIEIQLTDTASTATGMALVRDLRTQLAGPEGLGRARAWVGGFFAAQVDEEDRYRRALPVLVGVILGVTLAVLALAFRSALIPAKAVLLNLASVAGALGATVAVFQLGWGARWFGLDGPMEFTFLSALVIVFAVAFGLSMDYEVFLLARIKEAFDRTGDTDRSTVSGIGSTASVITAAAAIMVVVFGTFAFSRLLIAQMLGFGLAVAVLLDAFVVRLVIVPAFMGLAGRWNWWPGRGARAGVPEIE